MNAYMAAIVEAHSAKIRDNLITEFQPLEMTLLRLHLGKYRFSCYMKVGKFNICRWKEVSTGKLGFTMIPAELVDKIADSHGNFNQELLA